MILFDHLAVSLQICHDFIVHHEEWGVHSNKVNLTLKDKSKRCHNFCIAYELILLWIKPTCVPSRAEYHANLLNLFLTSFPNKCFAVVLSSLVSSHHSLIWITAYSNVPFHRTYFFQANMDSFRFLHCRNYLHIFQK